VGEGLILVSGLGRCGTSLMMQMLSAGGLPVFDREAVGGVAFEHEVAITGAHLPEGAAGLLKWLDPHTEPLPPRRVRGSIFLTRDVKQQALSQKKFSQAFVSRVFETLTWRELAYSLKRDTKRALGALERRGPVFKARFESLIIRPRPVIEAIAKWLGEPIDVDAAVAQVRPRGTDCLPGLLELQLMDEEKARAQAEAARG
jgi:hypothetical protein